MIIIFGLTIFICNFFGVYAVNNNTTATTTTQFPLCTICRCKMDKIAGKEHADVSCTSKVSHDIYTPNLWHGFDNKTNATYPYNYHSFTIQNNVFTNLTKEFPLSNLVYLNLAGNKIIRISQNIFKNLENMEVLILSYNDLDDIDPDAFKGIYTPGSFMPLRRLRELRLDHNKLHTLNQNIFEHTTDIEIFDLSHNPLKIIDHHTLVAITSLTKLKELYLQYTYLKTLPDTMLHTPKYLEVLDLSGNPISKVPKTLCLVHNLSKLYMNNTAFTNLTNENVFPAMPSVKVFHLCRNEYLHSLGRHSLSGLTNLEDVRICDNNVLQEIDPLAFAEPTSEIGDNVWPRIRKFYLGNNKLSHLDTDIVARWDQLTELDIRGNPWTCECENQWLIDVVYPIYLKIDHERAKEVMCAAPTEMSRYSFYELYVKKEHMRCLDLLGSHPENDAMMLVGILTGILIALPLMAIVIVGTQRKWFNIFGMFDNSPAAYSRRYYSTSPTEDI